MFRVGPLAALLLMLIPMAPVSASALSLMGTFTATDFVPGGGPETTVNGSFTISIDTSGLTGVGQEAGLGVVDAISLTAGGVVYTAGSLDAAFEFQGGVLDRWLFGTDVNVSASEISCMLTNTQDDVCLAAGFTPDSMFFYSIASDLFLYEAATVDIDVIPEPTTTLLLACGLVGLGVRRRLH
jgi:hypothetical protein